MQQGMVEGFASLSGGLHENAQVVNHLLLSSKTVEQVGAQGVFEVFLGLREMGSVCIKVTVHGHSVGVIHVPFRVI